MVVIPRYAPVFGGAENQCRLLNRQLVGSNRVTIVSVLTSRIQRSVPARELIDGIPVRRLGTAGVGRWAFYWYFLSTAAYLVAQRTRYDVIHCHGTSLVGFVATLAGWVSGKPVVVKLSTNGELLRSYSGPDRGRREGLWARLHRLMGAFTVRHAHTIALNGQGLAELRAAGAPRALVIPNGVDTTVFRRPTVAERAAARARLGLPDSAVVFAFTGRFVRRKGLDLLLPAFRTLLAARGAQAVRLVLVGSGELQEESIAEALTPERLGPDMARAVQLIPATDDVRPFLFAGDVFVMPSTHEGLSNAVLEAIACGMVCVLSDIPPHQELRERSPDHPIYLFSSGDSHALAATLERSYTAVRANGGPRRESRSGLGPTFSIGAVTERYIELLRDLAQRESR